MPEDILTKCMRLCCCGPARAPGYYGNSAKTTDRPAAMAVNGQNGFGFCHHAPPGECPVCNTGRGPRNYRMPDGYPETAPGPWLARYWGPWGGQGPWHLQ
ncbi:hypothetical protein BV898_06819 [Hypsibius exemplaris]|uniref:Uncharacterized protein n=1 Tax=Hypsibius exemplaris TaxID=2072580 RepID=A0A1W0WVF8_HYPEX|nr:hypothetical protein BV898_06819 [Hypsibius exemplaris]